MSLMLEGLRVTPSEENRAGPSGAVGSEVWGTGTPRAGRPAAGL